MPRYFFHTEDGRCVPDEEGTELPNLEAAKRAAQRYLGEILRDLPDLWDEGSFRVIVRDEAGLTVAMLDVVTTEAPVATGRASSR